MKDTPFDTIHDEPLEARIVAWVLGEASSFEAAELERLCEERPELLVFRRRMRALHGLLTDAESAEPDNSWKLPEEKRKVLDEIFGEEKVARLEPDKEARIRRGGRRALLAIAACLMLTLFLGAVFSAGNASIQKSRKVKAQEKFDFLPGGGGSSGGFRGGLGRGIEADRGGSAGGVGMVPLSIELPKELIEETPKPINVPNLEAPVNGPAGSSSWRSRSAQQPSKLMEEAGKLAGENFNAEIAQDAPDEPPEVQEKQSQNLELAADGVMAKAKAPSTREPFAERHRAVGGSFGSSKSSSYLAERADADGVTNRLGHEGKDLSEKNVDWDSRTAEGNGLALADADGGRGGTTTAELGTDLKQGTGKKLGLPQSAAIPTAPARSSDRQTQDIPNFSSVAKQELSRRESAQNPPAPAEMSAGNGPVGGAMATGDNANLSFNDGAAVANELPSPAQTATGKAEDSIRTSPAQTYEHTQKSQKPDRALDEKLDQYWDTSKPGKSGGTEYEIRSNYTSEYLFRGIDSKAAKNDEVLPEAAKTNAAKITPLESIEEIAATEEPYSTFSLNINDSSFQIAKAALEKGERPDPAAIKVEQFYNAVDYGDPAPASNEPVAARIEQSAHPIIPGRNLVRVSLKTAAAGRGASQPLRLTLLVDQSGSMVREDRRAAMTNALKQLGGLLTPDDHITVVGFSRESHLLADNWTGDKAGKLGDLVNQTASEGGTNLEQAINLAEQMAARPHPAGEQNRIVLFTDGAANLGNANPARLAERVKSLRQQGIAFDIAGIGADGVNDRLLSELARNGNGRYYVVGDSTNETFARQLAGAFRPAAENVKVQVHFNPDRVGRYKLIGFEKDRLKTEDFRNDAVDAAELAAEEAGVAIYQVETLPQGSGEIGEVSVRFRDTSKGEMVERKWTMPFESTTQVFDRATPSMQLAGLSMLAAEKLKGGPLADAIDFRQLSGSHSLVKQFYGSSPRIADMLHVIDRLK